MLFKRHKKEDHNAKKESTHTIQKETTNGSFLNRLKQGLTRTRQKLTSGLADAVLGKKSIDAELLETIETQLLLADVGVDTTQKLVGALTEKVARKELNDGPALWHALQTLLRDTLVPYVQPLEIPADKKPFVILVVGVNGAGKTTTIGKIAKQLQAQHKRVLLAAGDTFRAAAIDQLRVWGERNQIPVIAQDPGADSAAVIFDAIHAAQARGIDVVLADTAGRLHTQSHLMDELQKVNRVIKKCDASAPHEVLLVLDAGIGQNALQQAKQFHHAIPLSGLAITKLDGTAKGGIVFAIARQLQLPIRYVGVGEGIDDLRTFSADDFVTALFSRETEDTHDSI